MTKNEALKAAIDGKKIRNLGWTCANTKAITWDGVRFKIHDAVSIQEAHDSLLFSDGWEIVPEFVDFAEAWKAYEDGKTIQSTSSGEKYQNKQYGAFIRADAIRGKWLILEDK